MVERNWFHYIVGGRRDDGISAEDDNSWDVSDDGGIQDALADFGAVCAESGAVAAGFDLDETFAHERLGRVSLRYVYVRLIREHSGQAGHADILRELTDGKVGDPNVPLATPP